MRDRVVSSLLTEKFSVSKRVEYGRGVEVRGEEQAISQRSRAASEGLKIDREREML